MIEKKVKVFDIETNQEFTLELEGDQVVMFKRSISDEGKFV